MNKKNFDLLVQSMREGAEILHGTREPSRRFVVEKKEDVQQVRQAFHLSQNTFAKFMGVSVGTLRNWEQGRRRPTGAARVAGASSPDWCGACSFTYCRSSAAVVRRGGR